MSTKLPLKVSETGGWTLHEYEAVPSTNDVAAKLGPWHAVQAAFQTAGRGRYHRNWVSGLGGLWISAVLPAEGDWRRWQVLPLGVGLAIADLLVELGVDKLRLRWPNDILVRDRKLAGLLLEQFHPGLVVVGIGLNVTNQPELADASLAGMSTRLSEHWGKPIEMDDLVRRLLRSLRAMHEEMVRKGFESLLPRLNPLWGAARRVELDLRSERILGWFEGIDGEGRLCLRTDQGSTAWYSAPQVVQLREVA